MSPHLARGLLLMQQERGPEAIKEFQAALGAEPDDFRAHAFLAILHARAARYKEAEEHAGRALAIAPDEAFAHVAQAQMLFERNRFAAAEAAVAEAIRLEPHDAEQFSLLASCRMMQERWRDAVAAADSGLALDPAHAGCATIRSQALLQLGDRAGAAATIAATLHRNPDAANAHASQGWAALHGNDPRAAVDHFREALRLEPTNEFARLGIVEALKARNPIYRWLLRYFLWTSRLPRGLRWGLVIGGVLGSRALRQVVGVNPALIWPVGLLLAAYAIFIVLTWIGDAVFNLLLLLDPVGRHALSDDQRRGAQVFGCVLLLVAGLAGGGVAVRSPALLMAAILWGLTSLVVPSVWRCERGWPRRGAAAAVSTVAALAAVMTAALVVTMWNGTSPRDVFAAGGLKTVALLFLPVLLGTMILSQIMIRVQVRH